MEKIVAILGEKLIGKDGEVETCSMKECAYIGVYFSAHWCPPCRAFTPALADKYRKLGKDKLEVVFVRSDENQKEFDDYFKEMPWLAIPYNNEEKRTELDGKFEIEGIPTLVILDGKTGDVVREDATGDLEGDEFPPKAWLPVGIDELLQDKVIGKSGGVPISSFTGKGTFVGLYFSAHWCPPCRAFTPQLIEKYNKWKESGASFEIVFISLDRDKKSFDDYYKDMPWLTLPFENENEMQRNCASKFGVRGIPSLIILDGATGKVHTKDGKQFVSETTDKFPFPIAVQTKQ